jgi:sulfur-oxidizing protein SoxY
MTNDRQAGGSTRRQALATGLVGLVFISVGRSASIADEKAPAPYSEQFKKAYDLIVGDATVTETGVAVELPEVAENGNFVPVTIKVDSPMTDDDHVQAVHILSTANPVGLVATFHLSPINGTARIQSRMRLASTQDVVVIAQTSKRVFAKAVLPVSVTIGGCQT